MSRCLPFPPPGYEKKVTLNDVILIPKEKHKQEKHKKKKDKEKKDKNGKKEKEQSEGKHKKDKEEDKKRPSEENPFEGSLENQNGEALGPSRKPQDLRKKHQDKDKKEDKERPSEEKQLVGSLENQNGEVLGPSRKPQDQIQDRILVELGKRLRDDIGATGNLMVQKNILMKQKNGLVRKPSGENQHKVEGGSRHVDSLDKGNKGEKEKKKHRTIGGKGDGQKSKDRYNNSKEEDNKKDKKEETKQRESTGKFLHFHNNKPSDLLKESHHNQGNLLKRKEPPLNGFSHDNGIRPNNVPRPASSSQVKGSGSDPSQRIINLGLEKGGVITNHKVNSKVSSSQPFFKNVKSMEPGQPVTTEHGKPVVSNHAVSNGFSSPRVVGNERKIEPYTTATNAAKVDLGVGNNLRVDNKNPPSNPLVVNGRRMARPDMHGPGTRVDSKGALLNVVLEGKPHVSSSSKERVDTLKKPKPPHPDSKYLNEIYSVPPKLECPQFDDQEWLFGSEDSRAKRPKLASSRIEPTKQVWAETVRMDAADITALPYVVPY